MDPYRLPESAEESATMKVVRDAEREMIDIFARLLSTTDPPEIEHCVSRIDALAHERALGLRLEAARRMVFASEYKFIVKDDIVQRAPEPEQDK